MNVEEFTRFAQSKGWKCSSNSAYGVYNEYPFSATFRAAGGGAIGVGFQTVGKGGGKLVRAVRKALPKGCTFVVNVADSRYTLTCTAKGGDLAGAFTASLDAVTACMEEAGLRAPDRCPIRPAKQGQVFLKIIKQSKSRQGNKARWLAERAGTQMMLGNSGKPQPLRVLLRQTQFKGVLVAEHGKDDVGDFVHYGAQGNLCGLLFALLLIVGQQDRIRSRPFRLWDNSGDSGHVEHGANIGGATLRHRIFRTGEAAGLPLGWV